MATLQATRAFVLGLPLDISLSWGLNRAIFYAAAKRGFKKPTRERPRASIMERPILEEKDVYFLGDELAYKAEEQGKPASSSETSRRRPRTSRGRSNLDSGAGSKRHGRRLWSSSGALTREFSSLREASTNRSTGQGETLLPKGGPSSPEESPRFFAMKRSSPQKSDPTQYMPGGNIQSTPAVGAAL